MDIFTEKADLDKKIADLVRDFVDRTAWGYDAKIETFHKTQKVEGVDYRTGFSVKLNSQLTCL